MGDYCTHRSSVPVHTLHLFVKWCHYCFTWEVHCRVMTEPAEGSYVSHSSVDVKLGPFDGPYDALELATALLRDAVLCPGAPWDRGERATPYDPTERATAVPGDAE